MFAFTLKSPWYVWLLIILFYYFLATFLPVDKIIGKIYPFFGVALLIMAFGVGED